MNRKFILENDFRGPVSTQELLDDLKRVANELGGEGLTSRRYNEIGKFSAATVSERFGSWNEALKRLELSPVKVRNYPDETLFSNMMTVWEYIGRQPRFRDMGASPSKITAAPYQRRFGSWIDALKAFVAFANSEEIDAPVEKQMEPDRQTPRAPSLRLRFKVLQRDNFKCTACGASPATQTGLYLHIDHRIAWSKGGQTVEDNLQTLCDRCNLGKSNIL
ncbi:MAG: homing endonuclease associated repeat-containing protein [Methylococcales bacterium]